MSAPVEVRLPENLTQADDEHFCQYGGTKRYPRTATAQEIARDAMLWVATDVARVCDQLGIPFDVALSTLQTYYVDAVEKPRIGSHADPLAQSWYRRRYHAVHPTIVVGWKFGVLWIDAVPAAVAPLVEGGS